MNNFQTILVAIFIAFFVFAVLIFSGLLKIGGSSSSSSTPTGKIVIWGTFDSTPEFEKVFEDMNSANKDLVVSYTKKNKLTYAQDLVESFAAGNGPDLFIVTPDMIDHFKDFVYKIPYASYPQKTFQDAFIDGASVYLNDDGAIGFPLVVDPIVLYYNKDLLSNEGISQPPQYWSDLFSLNNQLTKRNSDGSISQSMIALGRYDNVNHAKDILATLLLQSNNPIVDYTGGKYVSVLNNNQTSSPTSPFVQILNFFTEFSNPADNAYSWNRSLPNSLDMFTGGKLVFYIGRASELFKIESINPNLSFDVAQIMQTKGTNLKRTDADIYAIAVNKKSANISAAFSVAGLLAGGDNIKNLSTALSLPPASRQILATNPTDPYLFTFFKSAIVSRSFADPDPNASDTIFSELIQNIISNKLSVEDAITKAQGEMQSIIK